MLTRLRNAGYDPFVQVFEFVTFEEIADPIFQEVAPTAKTYTQDEFQTMSYSGCGDTEVQTITPVDIELDGDRTPTGNGSGSGCDAADFTGFPAGNIALMQRGACAFAVKAVNAQNAGAKGAIVFNQRTNAGTMGVIAGTLGETAQDGQPNPDDVDIPVIGISFDEGARLANEADPTTGRIVVDAESDRLKSTNVFADTRGDDDNTVVMGAHLDSEGGAGHQRQRLGLGVPARDGAPDEAQAHPPGEPRAVRLVRRRGVRPGRRDAVHRGNHR